MMHSSRDHDKRHIRRRRPVGVGRLRRRGRRRPPRIHLAVDKGQPVVRDVPAAVLVHGVGVWRGGDVERVDADDALVLQRQRARDQRQLVGWDAGSSLEETPLCAVF